jgi:hypothetical protein
MNFYWGGTPMSYMRFLTLQSFRYYNPDWVINLYQPEVACSPKNDAIKENEDFHYSGIDYRERAEHLNINLLTWNSPIKRIAAAQASDLFQWHLLGNKGGFYSDMDILYVKPMEEIHATVQKSDAIFCLEGGGMAIGFFASIPDCTLFKHVYERAKGLYKEDRYQCTGVEAIYYLSGLMTRRSKVPDGMKTLQALKALYPTVHINTIPGEAIYLYDWIDYKRYFTLKEVLPNVCVGIHWFGGGTISQEWNNKLTPDLVNKTDNTFCNYARKVQ